MITGRATNSFLATLALVLATMSVLFSPASPARAAVAVNQATATAAANLYRLSIGDRVRVTVFNEASLSGEFRVSDTGSLSLPLIGELKAAGLTVVELQNAAAKAWGDGYIIDPKVTVEVLSYRPFYILGEVNKPGEYPFLVGMTVLKAIATANGFTYRGNTKVVLIKHDGEDQEREIRLDPTIPVQPGDTIRIKERFF